MNKEDVQGGSMSSGGNAHTTREDCWPFGGVYGGSALPLRPLLYRFQLRRSVRAA